MQKVSCRLARLWRSRDIGKWRGRRSCSRPAIRVCLRRVMCGRIGEACGIGGGRKRDVGAVRARVSEGDVMGTLRGR